MGVTMPEITENFRSETQPNGIEYLRACAEAQIEKERQTYAPDDNKCESKAQENAGPDELQFSSKKIIKALYRNQVGDAELFRELNRGQFIFDHAAGQWYRWAGHFWQPDRTEFVVGAIQGVCQVYETELQRVSWQLNKGQDKKKLEDLEKVLRRRLTDLQGMSRIKDVLALARAGADGLATDGEQWDTDPMIIACQNAVVDLTTGQSTAGQPDNFIKTVCPIKWKGLECPGPIWERFLEQIFDGNQELISFIQRLFGYFITGKCSEEIFPVFIGSGRNGKTKLIEALKGTIGDYSGTMEVESLIEQKGRSSPGGARADKMSLRGKRFMVAAESEDGHRLNTSTIKHLTGGDSITARAPYGRYQVEFLPTHKMVLLSNFEPRINNNDSAIWARVLKIPFSMKFVDEPKAENERQIDRALSEKLKTEYPAILAWCVRGCLEWQKNGLKPPKIVKMATDAYRVKNDMLADFLQTCCQEKGEIQAKIIFDAYSAYCEESGLNPLSMNKFTEQMAVRFDKYTKNKKKFYIGISLLGG